MIINDQASYFHILVKETLATGLLIYESESVHISWCTWSIHSNLMWYFDTSTEYENSPRFEIFSCSRHRNEFLHLHIELSRGKSWPDKQTDWLMTRHYLLVHLICIHNRRRSKHKSDGSDCKLWDIEELRVSEGIAYESVSCRITN